VIDHIAFPVSDYARSKAFYSQALAPLGYTLVMEIDGAHTESRAPAAGFGKGGKPDFWIGGKAGSKSRCTSPSSPPITRVSTHFTVRH
jgi:catechol 2,3-dioxygenase-like lactoylglutathione lyase family enzyme